MSAIHDLHDDPDCPDCKARHRVVYSLHCRRCVARMIAREPPTVAAIRGEKLRKQLTDQDHATMLAMIAEERKADSHG